MGWPLSLLEAMRLVLVAISCPTKEARFLLQETFVAQLSLYPVAALPTLIGIGFALQLPSKVQSAYDPYQDQGPASRAESGLAPVCRAPDTEQGRLGGG